MKKNTKLTVLLMAAVLVLGVVIGGTISWLTDTTDSVTNTFVKGGDIDIDLDETTGENYEMIPGAEIDKDPFVTFKAGSVASWVFVKVDEDLGAWAGLGNFKTFLDYQIDPAWTLVPGTTNVYYIQAAATSTDVIYPVLLNDTVTVSDGVTDAMMDMLGQAPTLTFTAYAIQQEGFTTAAAAWGEFGI